jgi:hypothetical protein
MPWVTINGAHVLIGEGSGGGGLGSAGHLAGLHTGDKTSNRAINGKVDHNLTLTPAVQIGNKTFTGVNHVAAVDAAEKKLGPGMWNKISDSGGYLTNSGKYVSRNEASKMVGWRNSQMKAEDLRIVQMPKISKGGKVGGIRI